MPGFANEAKATVFNSNSVTKCGIGYYIQIAKSVYGLDLGEDGNSILTGFTVKNGSSQGVKVAGGSSPTISKCIIEDNGSGLLCTASSFPTVVNNHIRNNSNIGIHVYGCPIKVKNNWIYGNGGTGIRTQGDCSGTVVRNNTIVGNVNKGINNMNTAAAISNCILWNNGDDLSNCSATYSCIKDGDAGTGNIASDPCFVNMYDFLDTTDANGSTTTIIVADANLYDVNDVIEYDDDGMARTVTDVNTASGIITFTSALGANSVAGTRIHNWGPGATNVNEDYHLVGANSPCVDAGDPGSDYSGEIDIDFEERVLDGDNDEDSVVDMGGDEYDPNS